MLIITGPHLLRKYNDLRAQGYTAIWRGEGKIAMEKTGPPVAAVVIVEQL